MQYPGGRPIAETTSFTRRRSRRRDRTGERQLSSLSQENTGWLTAAPEGVRTRRLDIGGEGWRLWMRAPDGPAPQHGWPVLWVLDGADLFPLVAETARRLAARPSATGAAPAVVIGLDRDPPVRGRRYADGSPWPSDDPAFSAEAWGGADALLDLLTGPALEAAAQVAPLDRSRQVLIGHSFMAYFVLYALTQRPGAFRMFAALSPSIWWNEAQLLTALDALEDRGQHAFIAAGEREEPSAVRSADDARRHGRRMVSRAREAAALIAARLDGRSQFHLAPDEDHASVVPATLPRLLRAAFA